MGIIPLDERKLPEAMATKFLPAECQQDWVAVPRSFRHWDRVSGVIPGIGLGIALTIVCYRSTEIGLWLGILITSLVVASFVVSFLRKQQERQFTDVALHLLRPKPPVHPPADPPPPDC